MTAGSWLLLAAFCWAAPLRIHGQYKGLTRYVDSLLYRLAGRNGVLVLLPIGVMRRQCRPAAVGFGGAAHRLYRRGAVCFA